MLARYEGKKPARGGSAPLLVSRSALLALMVEKGQEIRKPADHLSEDPRTPDFTADDRSSPADGDHLGSPDVALLRAEVVRLQAAAQLAEVRAEVERVTAAAAVEQAQLTGQLAEARAQLAASERIQADVRQQLAAARLESDDWKSRYDAARAEMEALRKLAAVPWWRRLLPTKEG